MPVTGRARHVIALLLVVAAPLAGCIGAGPSDTVPEVDDGTDEPGYATDRGWSQPTEPAEFEVAGSQTFSVASFDGTSISVAVFFPEIDGCDWTADDLPERCRLPVVVDAGPYWADAVDARSFRPPLVEWLVPRGYAVAHMSVRGTGESGGCMEFMSEAEQRDVDETVTWLAEQAWSNGKVGMMGRSYDGTTPLMAAAQGNEHLETIVPISGVASVPDLMFKNGTSETRGPIMHSVVYWTLFGVGAIYGPDAAGFRSDHWAEQACEELVLGQARGGEAFATGDTANDYWDVRRFRQRILDDYDGSIWIVHGMQDWNVNPSQVVPWVADLQEDPEIETRAWLGQWNHHYPDRVDEHRNVRWDWADETLAWFDHYLKDEGPRPPLDVEVEDSLYNWRHEETYPPRDAEPRRYALSGDMTLTAPGDADDGSFLLTGPPTGLAVSGDVAGAGGPDAVFTSAPLDDDLRIAGLPTLHVDVVPTTPTGGQLFAELVDVWPDGTEMRIGWAAMHLRHHDGGNRDPATLVPGETVTARMQFEPLDAHVAEGHRLELVLHKAGVEDVAPSKEPEPTGLELGDVSVLSLPTIERPATAGDVPRSVNR